MSTHAGLWKIVRFNWPWYAAAVATTSGGVLLLRSGVLSGPGSALVAAGIFAANAWVLGSLSVSHYVYDRSGVSRGEWLHGVASASVRRVAVLHAGQDEASEAVARLLPDAEILVFDFHDPTRNGTPSLERARALADGRAVAMAPNKIPLNDAALDLGLVVFAAHEIRRAEERAAFFRELARAMAPTGRLLIVEHLRDGWNFLAYGPGAFHFLSEKSWEQSFRDSGLELLRAASCTPFVRVFELGKAP